MNKEILKEKLQEIFCDIFGDNDIIINESTNANDIEAWDSLKHISILAAVQDEFGIAFEMNEIIAMKTVGDMLEDILRKL